MAPGALALHCLPTALLRSVGAGSYAVEDGSLIG